MSSHTWVAFLRDADPPPLPADARVNVYALQSDSGRMIRVESGQPFQLEGALHGVTQHLHYTTNGERADLVARSRAELTPSPETMAVLIPIRKSDGWWQLAHDQRGDHFHGTPSHAGHTTIGAAYVERIFRKLYHCRYVNPPCGYDFLTYFEFETEHTALFQSLLSALRDPTRNPEWQYVEAEQEVWMTKIA